MVMNVGPENREFKDGFVVTSDTPEGHASWSGAVEALVRNLKLIKIWAWLRENGDDSARVLANVKNLEAAMGAMDNEDLTAADMRARVFDALEVKEAAEKITKSTPLTEVLASSDEKDIAFVEHGGITHTLEEWLDNLRGQDNPDSQLVEKIEHQMKELFERVSPKELRGIEGGLALGKIEDKLLYLKQLREIEEAKDQATLTAHKTAVGRLYGSHIANTGRETLWQVREGGQSTRKTRLEALAPLVREESAEILTEDGLRKLTDAQLIQRLDHVNDLRDNITFLIDGTMSDDDSATLRAMLIGIQTQYEDALAHRVFGQWRKGRRSEEWSEDLARYAVKRTLDKKLKGWSVRIQWKKNDDMARWNEISTEAERESKVIIDKLRRRGVRVSSSSSAPEIRTPTADQFQAMKQFQETDAELRRIMGSGNKYNLFEDTEFWNDLARGQKGIDRIIQRARPSDEVAFRKILEKMGKDREPIKMENLFRSRTRYGLDETEGSLDDEKFAEKLSKLVGARRYGAAANVMLEYVTRVGVRESGQDLEFMMIRRNFINTISKISPDFAAQFEMNQMLGYLPNLSSQKIEDFLASYQRLNSKGNLDIILGANAMMGANQIRLENGREITYSVKTFKSILRDERYMMRILSAEPNTMDSTLQGIMIEEMFGRGARMEPREVDGQRILFLALPGQDPADWRKLSDVKVDMKFADLDTMGFKGWSTSDVENNVSLEDMLNRNQWILRDGMTMMWYSEEWKHIAAAKSYQTALMGAAPKALLTSDVAKAVYQMHFGNVPPPMAELAEVFGGMLSAMSVYKAKDMVGRNVARRLWEGVGVSRGGSAKENHERFKGIGELFTKMHVRTRTVDVEGRDLTFGNKLRTNEMARLAFNSYGEESSEVLQLLRNNFENLKMQGIPTDEELVRYHRAWKVAKAKGKLPEGKAAYFGQEYDALWQEVHELQMTPKERALWNSITADELNILWQMNDMMFGKPQDHILVVNPEETELQALAEMKSQFLSDMHIGAFVAETGTTNGDDFEQLAMKYSPAKYEALKSLYKLISLRGSAADLAAFVDQIQLFMEPGERLNSIALVENRLGLACSDQLLTPLHIPLTTSRKHQKENPAWKFWRGHDGEHLRGTNEVIWVTYTDENNRTYFARTANGDRAYEQEEYHGNWSRNELGVEFWRASDMEIVNSELRTRGLLDKHSMHTMNELALGSYRDLNKLFGGIFDMLGVDAKNKRKLIKAISGFTNKGKLLALKLFLFNDPKYAFWTLAHEVVGFSGKTLEQILGFSVGGGGGGHKH